MPNLPDDAWARRADYMGRLEHAFNQTIDYIFTNMDVDALSRDELKDYFLRCGGISHNAEKSNRNIQS